jgi:hypothetical protein
MGVRWSQRIEAEMGRRVPETQTLRACITKNYEISGGHVPVGGAEEMNSVRQLDVTSSPGEIISD